MAWCGVVWRGGAWRGVAWRGAAVLWPLEHACLPAPAPLLRSIAVLYAAEYGFSDRLSQTLARGITKAGVQVGACVRGPRGPCQLAAAAGLGGLPAYALCLLMCAPRCC